MKNKIGYIYTENFKYNTFFTLEVGREYKINTIGKLKNMFTYYENPIDTLENEVIDNDSIVLKVEVIGESFQEEGEETFDTNHIKVLEIVDQSTIEGWPEAEKQDIEEFDKRGNLIYFKDCRDGFEYWKEYDQNNNVIHYKNSDNYEEWRKFDSNNNEIYFKSSLGLEKWKKFHNGNCIYYKNSNGIQWSLDIK